MMHDITLYALKLSLIIPSHIIKKLIPVAFRVDMMEFLFNDFIYKCVVVPTGSYSDYSECTQIDFFILKVDQCLKIHLIGNKFNLHPV